MRWTIMLLLAFSMAPAAGCIIESSERPFVVVGDGTLTLRWSINGKFDPNQCFQGSVERLRVFVFHAGGGLQGEYVAPCQDFATTLTLPSGSYTGEALLEGAAGPRTTRVSLGQVALFAGRNAVVELDFPAASFF